MAEIALIADTHAGIRNDASIFHDVSKRFYDNIFFPELKKRGIDRVIHLGDIVDRRKFINFYTASRLKNDFIQPLEQMGCRMDVTLGNHDIFFRDVMDVSIATEFLHAFKHLTCWDKPSDVIIKGLNVLLLPWICESNRETTTNVIKSTHARVAIGHLELYGFEMYRGVPSFHGEDPSIYSKFDLVCTGHYHHRSERGNIRILGSHGQFNWSDHGDERGFHILDTDTLELTFIRNPYDMFVKVHYDDNDDCLDLNFANLKEKYVKVIVRNRNKQALYDSFLSKIDESGTVEYTVVDDHLNADLTDDDMIVSDAKDTLTIIKEYVGTLSEKVDTKKLDSLMVELYKEAQNVE